jgi:phosphomannomutase
MENIPELFVKISKEDANYKPFEKYFPHGTSGFRFNEEELDRIAFRIGIVTCIKSKCIDLPFGVMITASHNKYTDNGFKVASFDGEGIDGYWEEIYEKIINSKDLVTDLINLTSKLMKTGVAKSDKFMNNKAVIIVAQDTRRSSKPLMEILK